MSTGLGLSSVPFCSGVGVGGPPQHLMIFLFTEKSAVIPGFSPEASLLGRNPYSSQAGQWPLAAVWLPGSCGSKGSLVHLQVPGMSGRGSDLCLWLPILLLQLLETASYSLA